MFNYRASHIVITLALVVATGAIKPFHTDISRNMFQVSDDQLVTHHSTNDKRLKNFLDAIFQGNHNRYFAAHTRLLFDHGFRPFPPTAANIHHISTVLSHKKFPNILIKTNVNRIRLATEMRNIISMFKLDHLLYVPQKTLYHIPGKSYELNNDNYLVVVERLKNIKLFHHLSNHEMVQHITPLKLGALCFVVKITLWADCHCENVALMTDSGKIAIIDTEERTCGALARSQELNFLRWELNRLQIPLFMQTLALDSLNKICMPQ